MGGGTLTEGALIAGGALIFFPTQNDHVMRLNGRRFDGQTFRLEMPGEEICLSSTDWHSWCSISVPNDVLATWNDSGTAGMATFSRFIHVPWEKAETFRRVLAQLNSLVKGAPTALASASTIDTTARKLTESIREVFWHQPIATTQQGRLSIPRRQIVRMVMDSIDHREGEYLTVLDLASAAGVSERTLRTVFQEYFGMGPVRYLKLRTLNLIRKALQNTDPSVRTVTEVATQFGVWELGRFARDYQLLFGERPSETLRNAR